MRQVVVAGLLLPFLLGGSPPPRGPDCLSYAPAVVTLEGTLGMAGGTGEMGRGGGDRDLVLLLDKPVCVRVEPSATHDWRDHDDIRMVQLVIASAVTAKSTRHLLRARIVVRGQLVEGTAGMQRTKVVLEVEAVWRR